MTILIYGAYGYTGQLITHEAVDRNFEQIIIAGRNRDKLEEFNSELQLTIRVFDLSDVATIVEQIKDVDLVLHCAGPFSATAEPMMEACIKAGVHYLDITGEIGVFKLGWELDDRANEAGIIMMPGVGFDVVPSDCLAYRLKQEMPDANYLEIAFYGKGGSPSQGTQKSSLEAFKTGGYIRENGELKQVPLMYDTKEITFKAADEEYKRLTMTIPWGDVFTAYHSTKIPNIMVYIPVHPSKVKWVKLARMIRPLLAWTPVQKVMKWSIGRGKMGPDEEELEQSQTYFSAKVCRDLESEDCVEQHMITPNGYVVTKEASLIIAGRILDNPDMYSPGFHTPAELFGDGLLEELSGISFV